MLLHIVLMFLILLAAEAVTIFTNLQRYDWYANIATKILTWRAGWCKTIAWKVYSFPLWVCRACQTFWLSLVLGILVAHFYDSAYPFLTLALINFLMIRINEKEV